MYQINLLIIISYKKFLVTLNAQAVAVKIGNTINPKPVLDIVTELEVVAILTRVSTVLKTVDVEIQFYYLFVDL